MLRCVSVEMCQCQTYSESPRLDPEAMFCLVLGCWLLLLMFGPEEGGGEEREQ